MNEELLKTMLVGRCINSVTMDGEEGITIELDNGTELIVYADGNKLVAEVAS
jgi:hypothetical protein